MNTDIQIRRAGPADTTTIADLSTITFIETYRGSCTEEDIIHFIDKYFNEQAIAQELADPDDYYYLVFFNGFPAGYIRIKEEESEYPLEKKFRAIQVKRIYVLKEFHSKKIGSKLICTAMNLAAEKGYELVWLGVWEGNTHAKLFYNKLGFTDINQTYSFFVGNTEQTDRWMIKFVEHTS